MTDEHWGYKPGVDKRAKFEYSPLGELFNKGLKEDDKKETILKRLDNIKGTSENQLKTIKDEQLKLVKRIRMINPKVQDIKLIRKKNN